MTDGTDAVVHGNAWWWGTAASAVQTEGACAADDWYAWERAGHAPASLDGNGFATRYREDFALLAGWGFTDHRWSLNWARVQPQADRIDQAAVEHYRRVLTAGRESGLRMWVTLLHTALPQWFSAPGGFGGEVGAWGRWVEFAAETFGDLVDGWMPVNNPTSFAQKAYLTGTFPPGHTSPTEFGSVLRALHQADFDAALRLRRTGKPVCSNESLVPLFPADDSPAAAAAAAALDHVVWNSWLDLARTEQYTDAFDCHGFSYYGAAAIGADGRVLPYPPDAEPGPLGYVPWADGIATVLQRLVVELPGVPLVVCELGYGGDDDARVAYLSRAMRHVRSAREQGTPVAGVFFWTGIDNYEWLHGRTVPFGLFDEQRRPRGSAQLVREWAQTHPA